MLYYLNSFYSLSNPKAIGLYIGFSFVYQFVFFLTFKVVKTLKFLNNKGQAALEYLMTYGWALVVMVVVIAALVALDIFNLGSVTDTCAGFPTTVAYQRHVYDATGTFQISLLNGTGQTIDINRLSVDGTDKDVALTRYAAGASIKISNSGYPAGTATRSYKVPVVITYNIMGLDFNNVKAQGTCLGKYQ